MSVLLDSGPIIAFLHERDRLHKDASRLLGPALDGELGSAIVSDYVADEVLTFLVARGASERVLEQALAFLVGGEGDEAPLDLRHIGPDLFHRSTRLLLRQRERGLSFTDCTSLALMDSLGIGTIASFDRGFDGLVHRLGT